MPPKSLAERMDVLERQVEQLRLEMARLRAVPEPKTAKQKATLSEVTAFCESIGLPATDAEWFYEKNEGNGWKNGGKAIRDWKATLRSWKIAKYLPSLKLSYATHKNISSAPGSLNAGRYGNRG